MLLQIGPPLTPAVCRDKCSPINGNYLFAEGDERLENGGGLNVAKTAIRSGVDSVNGRLYSVSGCWWVDLSGF